MDNLVLGMQDVRFAWPKGRHNCLDISELQVAAGERVFLHGPSGCGKSTLLSLIAGVLLPQHGSIRLNGQDWRDLHPAARDRYRVDHVGYIFQQFNLLPYLSVVDNVMAPCKFSVLRESAAVQQSGSVRAAALAWLNAMGLEQDLWPRAARDLSVGQQQRVAAARALIGRPSLVIADEPTSALDEDRRNEFLDVLISACSAARSALVFVSHDRRIAERFHRRILLPEINRAALPTEVAA